MHTSRIQQVLRLYPSGKDAAVFLNVSQSGISLCCGNQKTDAYGFKWQFYEGPPVDWEAIEPYQTPLEKLQEMQVMRGKRGPYNTGYVFMGDVRG